MMRTTNHLLLCALFVSGCALSHEPEVPMVPAVAQMPVRVEEITPPYCPLDRIEVVLLPSHQEPPLIAKGLPAGAKKRGGGQAPIDVVTQAHHAARLEPTAQGYQGGSGEHVYSYAPGKVYTVYLTKKHGTGLFLPPGERLVSGLYLDGDAFNVKTERAGTEQSAYDAIILRPLTDAGEVDTFILTASGRRYLLHFVVGQTGMLAVTFEGPRVVTQARATAEPPLLLPRPPQ